MSDLALAAQIAALAQRVKELEGRESPEYSFGSYTPTYLGGTTAGVTTYAANGQVGHYTRIGRLVFFHGRVEWTAATGTGNAQISIPFTAVNVTNLNAPVAVAINNVTFTQGAPTGLITTNTAFFDIRSPITNAGSTIVQIEAAGIVNFSGLFEV